jgi:hypothetical protein
MFRTLFIKELREIWWIGLLPLGVMLYAAANEVEIGLIGSTGRYGFRHFAEPGMAHTIPFASESFSGSILLWGCILASGLGVWQTFRESQSRTWHFLLHRPVRRELILVAKLAAAATIYALAIVLPVVAVVWWAATPGTHASPFHWSMTASSWLATATGSALYLSALFAGLRGGRMTGTRWWPLIGAAAIFALAVTSGLKEFYVWVWVLLLLWDIVMAAAVRDELALTDFN